MSEIPTALLEQLAQRCKTADISLKETYFLDGEKYYLLSLPNGREKRLIPLGSQEAVDRMLSIEFEKYTFLGDYSAIASYEAGIMEAFVRPHSPMPSSLMYQRLFGVVPEEGEPRDLPKEYLVKDTESKISITLGNMSKTLKVLTRRFAGPRPMSMTISGLRIECHDEAVSLLERLSNAVFFQIDLAADMALGLAKERRHPRRARRAGATKPLDVISFPRCEYDSSPISLYWYARSAYAMPLLQYLAYYQVVEYYFPVYSQQEVRKRISNILKDPTFRADRDSDVARIFNVISNKGAAIGDERSQLKATLKECIAPDDIREFLNAGEEIRQHFLTGKHKAISTKRIAVDKPDSDLVAEVAERIYDIRCKIVHTKSDSPEHDVRLLLPFSKEAENLYYDIDLIQLVAQKVLVAASAPMKH